MNKINNNNNHDRSDDNDENSNININSSSGSAVHTTSPPLLSQASSCFPSSEADRSAACLEVPGYLEKGSFKGDRVPLKGFQVPFDIKQV